MLNSWEGKNFEQIIILPLFPQYASATNGSIIEMAMDVIKKWWVIPEVSFDDQFTIMNFLKVLKNKEINITLRNMIMFYSVFMVFQKDM